MVCFLANPEWLNPMRYILLFLFAFVSLSTFAADVNQLIAKANAGDAAAQYQLGIKYSSGDGVERDPDQAFAWFQKSARQGYAGAMYNLGVAYYNGDTLGGTTRHDIGLAWAWFTLAAEHGDSAGEREAARVRSELGDALAADAQYKLGLLLVRGEDIPRYVSRGLLVLQQAATAGSTEARLELGTMYEKGNGIPTDGAKAIYWFEQAAIHSGNTAISLHIAQIYLDGKLVPRNLDAAADTCKRITFNPGGFFCLGSIAESRTPPNYKEAAEWYRKGAQVGAIRSIAKYATLLAEGKGVKQDNAQAYYWLAVLDKSGYKTTRALLEEVRTKLSSKEIEKQDKAVAKLKIPPQLESTASR
jgi:TPR repeat protein